MNTEECFDLFYYGRIDTHYVFTFTPVFAVYLLLGVLLVYFRNDQPLKSRGSIPFILYFCTLILLQYYFILNMNGHLWSSNYICVASLFSYPFISVSILCGSFVLFRYIVIINLNNIKLKISIHDIQKRNLPFILRFVDFIGSDLMMFILSFLIISISWASNIILWIINGECKYSITGTTFTTTIIISSFFGYASIILDIIINLKILLTCKIKKFFLEDDIYYYRIEAIGILIICALGFILSNFLGSRLITSIFLCGVYLLLGFFGYGFILIITIIQRYQNSRIDNTKRRTGVFYELEKVFEKEETTKMFEEFCKNEFCIENFLLKKFIRDFKNEKYIKEKKVIAKEIYNTFIKEGSLFQVNISGETLVQVTESLEKDELIENLFDNVEKDLTQNLVDIFLRFSRSNKFITYINIEKIKQEMV